jgi:putative endonuclease
MESSRKRSVSRDELRQMRHNPAMGFWKRNRSEAEHLVTGRWGEKQAARWLKRNGWRIRGVRVRVGPHDEIDLIATCGKQLIFVEVKTRADETFGRPFSAVDRRKREALRRAARTWLKERRNSIPPEFFRFDVIEVIGQRGGPPPEIRHIEHAFSIYTR